MGKKNRRRQTKKALLPSTETNTVSPASFSPEDWRSATHIAVFREANITAMFESQLKHCRLPPPLELVMDMLELSKKTEKAAFEVAAVKELYDTMIELRTILPPVPQSLASPLSDSSFTRWFGVLEQLQFPRVLVTEALELLRGQVSEYRIILLALIYLIVTPCEVGEIHKNLLKSAAVGGGYLEVEIEQCMRKTSEDAEEPFFIRAMAMVVRASLVEERACTTAEACYKRRAFAFLVHGLLEGESISKDVLLPLFQEKDGLFGGFGCVRDVFDSIMKGLLRTMSCESGPSVPSILQNKRDNEEVIADVQSGEIDTFARYFSRVGGRSCDGCGRKTLTDALPVLLMCSACRLMHYCSRECQANAWKRGHRSCCKKFGRFLPGDRVILQGLTLADDGSDFDGWLAFVVAKGASSKQVVVDVISDRYVSGDISAVHRLSVPKKNLRHLRPVA